LIERHTAAIDDRITKFTSCTPMRDHLAWRSLATLAENLATLPIPSFPGSMGLAAAEVEADDPA